VRNHRAGPLCSSKCTLHAFVLWLSLTAATPYGLLSQMWLAGAIKPG
jgi:hypothetical protein